MRWRVEVEGSGFLGRAGFSGFSGFYGLSGLSGDTVDAVVVSEGLSAPMSLPPILNPNLTAASTATMAKKPLIYVFFFIDATFLCKITKKHRN